jgi:carboxymethylenebutenolidase
MNKMPTRSSEHQLTVRGRSVKAYLAEPQNGGPGILLLHAWWGLKPFFKQLCDRLAEQGYVALAPDLRNGHIARTIAEATELMEKSDSHFMNDAVLAAKDHLLSLPNRKGQKIGVLGFSMGAAWSLVVASSVPDQVAAAVLFYGSGEVDVSKIKAKILGHYSDVDEWEPYDEIKQLESKMQAAGVDVQFHVYPGRPHWFVEDDRPEYDPEAAKLAWDRTYEFLRRNL